MSAQVIPLKDYQAETVSTVESPDELWLDEEYLYELIDAINHNFVAEVDADHGHDD